MLSVNLHLHLPFRRGLFHGIATPTFVRRSENARRSFLLPMKIRLSCFIGFFLLVGIAVFLAQKIDYRPLFLPQTGVSGTHAALVRPPDQPESSVRLICSHGTNSHKEVFLPIAVLLAFQGISGILIDSTILSTNEGIEQRVEEIQSVMKTISADGSPHGGIIALGHSDGGPPSLAFMKAENPEQGSLLILGSQLSEKIPENVHLQGFVGGFDQIFPAKEMISDFRNIGGPDTTVRISWLSDHFTEQYDPLLLSAMADAATGRNVNSPVLTGLGLLFCATVVILAFSAGLVTGNPQGERGCYAWGTALFTWISLASGAGELFLQPLPAAIVLFFYLGFNCGFVPEWRHLKPFLIFFILMEFNVVLGTAFFWQNLAAALPWLPLFLIWYPVAWACKLALFGFSLMHRAFPDWLVAWHLPWLLLTLLPFVFSRGIIACGQRLLASSNSTERASSGNRQTRLAVALFVTMLALWCIRFSQGMIQADILQAVIGNLLRTLLLPSFYLIFLVFRRSRPT